LDKAEFQAQVDAAAQLAWHDMTPQQRTVVRFGMIPAEVVERWSEIIQSGPDGARLFAVALMDCADKNGGMRA